MELNIKLINGKFRDYTEVRVANGYSFYDVDAEELNYLEYIATPIVDEQEIRRKFVVVKGNAEELNEKLQEEQLEVLDE